MVRRWMGMMASTGTGLAAIGTWLQWGDVELCALNDQCWLVPLPMAILLASMGGCCLWGLGIELPWWLWKRQRIGQAAQPSAQLRALAGPLEQACRDLSNPGITDEVAWLTVHRIAPALESLDIPYPELEPLSESEATVDRREWSHFLAMVAGYALRGELDEAQDVCTELGL